MRIRLMLSVFAVLVGTGTLAHADIYAAGPAYGGNPTGGIAVCRLMNAGTSAVNITLRQVVTNTNVLLPLSSDTCSTTLAGGNTCIYTANVPGNFALACRAFVQGDDPHISGVMEMQNPFGTFKIVVPMQNTNN